MRQVVRLVMLGLAVTTLRADPAAQTPTPTPSQPPAAPTRANILRGEYGRYRVNNDLLYYHLDIKVDPVAKTIAGKNTIRFKMLQDDTRIQIDLYANLNVDKILQGTVDLKYERELGAVFIDFPKTLKKGRTYAIDFYYSGTPMTTGRFGGFVFSTHAATGQPWIFTACEGEGSSIWWPSKDQWHDEVESMDISITVPTPLVEVSNGRFLKKTDLEDGYTRWDWAVHYPINSYDVSMNATDYAHFDDKDGDLTLDFWATPENLEKARTQFAQAKPMIEAFKHFFGEYPFVKDGYKLIEVPYTGMEHQSAVTYGNGYRNGYGGRDWTGVGISPKFDFIIIHESGHEWFGNAVSAADRSDMWIQEGWCTYMEGMYVEQIYGKADGITYVNGYKSHVRNTAPIIQPRGINQSPRTDDQYFKSALFLNTLRSVVDDDATWWAIVRGTYDKFKYHNVMTEDVIAFFKEKTHRNLTAVFNQYLRHTALPVLELKFDEPGAVSYRWKVDEPGFAMPVKVGTPDHWETIEATTEWKSMKTTLAKDAFQVATDLFYVNVSK